MGDPGVSGAGIINILREAAKSLQDVSAVVERSFEKTDFFGNVAAKYRDFCKNNYSNIQILGMAKPVQLAQIYTQVLIKDEIQRQRTKSEAEILREVVHVEADGEDRFEYAINVTDKYNKVVILGRPGSGKSTFLKHLLLHKVESQVDINRFPILVPVNQISLRGISIIEECKRILTLAGMKHVEVVLQTMLSEGRVHFLIDGLDEARHDRKNSIIDEIIEISSKYPKCSYVVTCRAAAYEYWFDKFSHFEVQDFSREAIQNFVEKWFHAERDLGEEILSQIWDNQRILDLCRNPLMLTIVCIAAGTGLKISSNRGELYKDAIEALLKTWDNSRRIQREEQYKELSPKRREDMLCELASRTFAESAVVFSDVRAQEIIEGFVKTSPLPEVYEEIDADAIMRAIESQHGLVVKRSRTYWTFAHLTFQEYFTAKYILQKEGKLYLEVVGRYLTRPDWREVIILMACLLSNADEYIISILKIMTKLGYGSYFVRAVDNEIREATASRSYRQQEVDFLFKDHAVAAPGAPALRLIPGGIDTDNLSVESTRYIIDRYRSITAVRLQKALRSAAEMLIGDDQSEEIELDSQGEVSYRSRYESYRSKYDILTDATFFAFASDVDANYVSLVGEAASREMYRRHVSFRASLIVAARRAMAAYHKNNPRLVSDISRSLSQSNIYEITNRQFTHILPGSVELCVAEMMGVLNRTKLIGIAAAFRDAKIGGRPQYWIDAFKRAMASRFVDALYAVAAANEKDEQRLKGLAAAEVLADILTSDVYITPRVRLAAIRTLQNITQDLPPPPPDIPDRQAKAADAG